MRKAAPDKLGEGLEAIGTTAFSFACANCGFVNAHDGDCPICGQAPDVLTKEVNLYDLIFELQDRLERSSTPSPDLIRQARGLYHEQHHTGMQATDDFLLDLHGDVICRIPDDAELCRFVDFAFNNWQTLLDLAEQAGKIQGHDTDYCNGKIKALESRIANQRKELKTLQSRAETAEAGLENLAVMVCMRFEENETGVFYPYTGEGQQAADYLVSSGRVQKLEGTAYRWAKED